MRSIRAPGPMLGLWILAACGGAPTPTGAPAAALPGPSSQPTRTPSPWAATPSPAIAPVACDRPADWSGIPAAIASYGRAWNARDVEQREAHVSAAMSEEPSFVDPTMERHALGREAVDAQIAAAQELRADQYYEPRDWIPSDTHHGYAQLGWRLCGPPGDALLVGDDFLELDSDGSITRATRFFATEEAGAARPVCELPIGAWNGIPDIARKWAATAISTPETRAALVAEIFAEDGFYVDPSDSVPVVGHEAIVERVAGMLWEGAFFEPAAWTEGDDHHDSMRLRWRLCDGPTPALEGVDYVEIDEDGRMAGVVGFFPWP